MRAVVRDGIAFGLLWLAHGNMSWAAQSSSDNNITNTNNDIDSSHDYTISLITTTPTLSGAEAQLPRTCRSGTVNYITHSLPQQCPTSAWSAPAQYSIPGQNTTASNSPSFYESETTSGTTSTSGAASSSTPTNPTTVQDTTATESTTSTTTTSSSQESVTDTVASSSVTVQAASTDAEEELETDSPLDNVNFLSFDDWKKQNLEKAGQSPDGGQPTNTQARARPDIALDALGDEGEISLDFAGFGTGSTSTGIDKAKDNKKVTTNSGHNPSPNGPVLRSKDAGKTCKERSNYASFDCAATILKTNKEAKSANAILIEHKDSYMLNLCSAPNKFTIVELCDDILVDTIVLANYEFFSSIFRTFRVSVSDRYPVKLDRWKVLGTFEATNSRSVQAFLVEQPLIWARYLRIEWLTHFGNEYYCPVSLLRVHGTTMMEEYRHEEVVKRGEHLDDSDAEEEEEEEAVVQPDKKSPIVERVVQEPESVSIDADKSVVESLSATSVPVDTTTSNPQDSASTVSSPGVTSSTTKQTCQPSSHATSNQTSTNGTVESTGHSVSTSSDQAANSTSIALTVSPAPINQQAPSGKTTLLDKASSFVSGASETLIGKLNPEITPSSSDTKTSMGAPPSDGASGVTAITQSTSSKNTSETSNGSVTSPGSRVDRPSSISVPPDDSSSAGSVLRPSNSTFQPSSSAPLSASSNSSASQQPSQSSTSSPSPQSSASPPLSSSSQSSASSSSHQSQQKQQQQQRVPSSGTASAHHPSPTTQESFFKSISKRLQLLESNTTLSLQYIESQSLLLRNAFQAVEKRQLHKTTNFLSTLNATVTAELDNFRREQERLWEGVVIEMEVQRRMQEREVLMLGQRLGVLAEEVVWQKRVGVVQSTLLLLCLGLVIFTRSGMGGMVGLEMPLLQQLQLRRNKWGSQSGGRGWERDGLSPPQSPNPITDNEELLSPTSGTDGGHEKGRWGATRRRRGLWRNNDDTPNNASESTEGRPDTRDGTPARVNNPDLRFQSATPTSPRSPIEAGSEIDDLDDGTAGLDEGQIQEDANPDDDLLDNVEEEDLDLQDTAEEDYLQGDHGNQGPEHVMPQETQSSPSTPSGTRDQLALSGIVKDMPAWPTDGVVDGMIQM